MSADSLAHTVVMASPDPPPAPWRCRVEAVVWWHRAAAGSAALLAPGLRPGPPLTVGAFVRYLDTPVGPYDEVLACPHLLAGARLHLPFIAVDSAASVAGGRALWSLPKTLATFSRAGSRLRADDAAGGWTVAADSQPSSPWLPVAGVLGNTQVDTDGRLRSSWTRAAGRGRLARVQVEASDALASWLRPGRHHGLVLRARVVVGAAHRGTR